MEGGQKTTCGIISKYIFFWYIYPLQGKNNYALTEHFLLLIYYDATLL